MGPHETLARWRERLSNYVSHFHHQEIRSDTDMRANLKGLSERPRLSLEGLIEEPLQGNAGIDDVEQSAGTVVSEFADCGDGIGH